MIQELHEDNASLQDVDALGFIHFIVEAIHSLNLGDAFLPLKVVAESEGEGASRDRMVAPVWRLMNMTSAAPPYVCHAYRCISTLA